VRSIERILAARRRSFAVAIAVLAVGLRVVYFVQLVPTPFAKLHQAPETDMHYYSDWGRQIAAGDWLSSTVAVPSHRWHRQVARIYRTTHGVPSLGPDDSPAEERQNAAQWATWMHRPVFYQDPLYAYLLAMVYRVGSDARGAFVLQLVAGAGGVLLIWAIARRVFDDLVAAVAAILALLCGPLMFYEMLLLRDSLLVDAELFLTWLLLLRVTRERIWGAGAFGVVVGTCALLKSTILLFGILALGTMVASRWPRRQIAVAAIGIAVGLSPAVARNLAVGAPPLTLAASGPLTFLSANDVNYPADAGFAVQPALLADFLGNTGGTWRDAVARVVASQTVSSYATQLWDKWTRVWHWYEIPNNENFYYARRLAPVLTWLPVTMWAIAPLGLVGLVLAAAQIRGRWPLFLAVSTAILPLLIFYVLGRFRIAVVATLFPCAALTLVQAGRFMVRRRYSATILLVVSVTAVGLWTGQPLGPHQVLLRPADWIVPFSTLYEVPIEAAASRRHFGEAARLFVDYFDRYEPSADDMRDNPGLSAELAGMHRDCADLFAAAGDLTAAAAQRAVADRLQHR
jgi:Dolichyl-phosphate-mannose-protein mannosyltransferase